MFIDTIFITIFSSSSSESVISQAIASGPSYQTAKKSNVGANFHTIKKLHVRGYTFSFPSFLVSAGAVNVDGPEAAVEGRTTADADVDGTDTTAARVDVDGTTSGNPILESEDADTGLLVEPPEL